MKDSSLKNQEVLVGQEIELPGKVKTCGCKFLEHVLFGNFHVEGRPKRQPAFLKVDVHNPASGAQSIRKQGVILGPVSDMVEGSTNEDQIH